MRVSTLSVFNFLSSVFLKTFNVVEYVSKSLKRTNLQYLEQLQSLPKFNKNLEFGVVKLLQKISRKQASETAKNLQKSKRCARSVENEALDLSCTINLFGLSPIKLLLPSVLRSFFETQKNKQVTYNRRSPAEIVLNWGRQKISV